MTLDDLGVGGTPLTVNGKEGVIGYYQSLNPEWALDDSNDFYISGYEKLDTFSYIDNGVFVTIVLGQGTSQDALNEIIK